MSIGRDPLFRDQYAGGGDYSDDVAAALSGKYQEPEREHPKQLQSIAERRKGTPTEQNMFGRPVRLR